MLALLGATAVVAQDEALDGKLRTGQNVTVGEDESVAGDLYAAAGLVVVDGTIDGDLIAVGGDVRINGTVVGDLIAAGGTVTIAGTVAGDARVAAGQLMVSGDVGEDLLASGGQATLAASGSVGEDVIVSAGQLTLAGSVAGSVAGGAGSYERTGTIDGDENVAVGDADDGEDDDSNPIVEALQHFLAVLIVGAVALWLAPRLMRASAERIRRRPLQTLGAGLLTALGWVIGVIAVVVVVVLAAIVLGLVGLGDLAGLIAFAGVVVVLVATFAVVLVAAYLADALVALALVGAVRDRGRSLWTEILMLAIGAAILVLLTSLPYVGGFLKLVVILLGLGALASTAWSAWRGRRPATRRDGIGDADVRTAEA
jgi:cytoskeletal protein CcmA (bactofilin family)